ncbi:hypothetical protein IWX90DRAFT_423968 [Phyllosticta citrichinensis]|uniref:Uncharacterized protein n=1 Tax=Phyllosticta citrichinensis TaxID=1130410 RepID=A0ABR1Y350_9PEZI
MSLSSAQLGCFAKVSQGSWWLTAGVVVVAAAKKSNEAKENRPTNRLGVPSDNVGARHSGRAAAADGDLHQSKEANRSGVRGCRLMGDEGGQKKVSSPARATGSRMRESQRSTLSGGSSASGGAGCVRGWRRVGEGVPAICMQAIQAHLSARREAGGREGKGKVS